MSTQTFPSLIGLQWNRKRAPGWDTILQQAASGAETRIAQRPYPKWTWSLGFSYLGSGALNGVVNNDLLTLQGFYNARQGMYDTFLYSEPNDNSVTAQAIGTGNGSTAAYQLVRTLGGFSEPITAPNAVGAVYLAGASIPAAGLSVPVNGTLSSASAGSLAATTYYVKCTWVTSSGETLASTETNLAVGASKVLHVANPASPPAGAIGWNVYVSNTAGGSGNETLQNSTPIATGSIWIEPTTGLIAGAALPVANTTGWSFVGWSAASSNGGSGNPGTLTFAGNVANGVAITADFTYYWPVRFDADSYDFINVMNNIWSMDKIGFTQVYN